MMLEQKTVETLKMIYEKLKGEEVKWVLTGSTNLALQGLKIKPKDIDILTDKEDAFKINKLLKEYETEPVKLRKSNIFQSYFGKFKIKELNVEVMGNLRVKTGGKWTPSRGLEHRTTINFEGMYLPVLSLNEELKSYEKLGRKKDSIRIRKIKEALKRLGN